MSDHDQESQSRWLEAIGHRIAELKEGIGATTQRFERIAAIKDELESIRKSIWERNRFWANRDKLKEIQVQFESLD